MVLCSAHGFEEFCSRQFWRILAERLSRAGYPALRFDYAGTADSAGLDTDPCRLTAWLKNIQSAIDWMRRHTGAEEVALVGLRLGSVLAAVAAQERRDISHVAMLAPMRSGAAYGRELRLSSRMIIPGGGAQSTPGGAGADHAEADPIEVCGFPVAPATFGELDAVDVTKLLRAPAPRILMVESGSRPKDQDAVARHFSELGARVVRRPFPGYQSMMVEPTRSRPCLRAIDSVIRWFDSDVPPRRRRGAGRVAPHAAAVIEGGDWIEAPVLFGSDGELVGIICEPVRPSAAQPCVAMVGSGRDSHIGWARSSVLLARHLAAHGIASLRFDPCGIGDSPARNAVRRTPLYALEAVGDIRSAIDLLQERSYSNIALYGACSGAYLAFHTAIADHRVRSLVLRNIPRFVWNMASAVDFALSEWFDISLVRRDAAPSDRHWRVAERCVDLLKSGKRGLNKFLVRLSDAQAEAQYVQSQMLRFSTRGGRILMVYGSTDVGRRHLDQMFGQDGAVVASQCNVAIRFIEGVDHNFTSGNARRVLQDLLHSFLLEPADRCPAHRGGSLPIAGGRAGLDAADMRDSRGPGDSRIGSRVPS